MTQIATTGIVIVSYNAPDALIATLASLRRAHNESAVKLILVDNASNSDDRNKIRAAITAHISEVGTDWRYIEEPENLGFSGGNNVGIREFLADDTITHICLLNSDVIVTDHWLDRMLAHEKDIISSVTNKADSEQCIPVDYNADLSEFIEAGSIRIIEEPYQRAKKFADRRYDAWQGHLVEADVTFFCVLLTKSACEKIGLLDETFFPGGFEDDDYCFRARKLGYKIFLARDTFIHHWGSASFGKLQYEYFSARAEKNKRYLEEKHGIKWSRRSEKPIVSFCMDAAFALGKPSASASRTDLAAYTRNLDHQIDYFETEFRNLSATFEAYRDQAPEELGTQIATARSYGDLADTWIKVKAALSRDIKKEEVNEESVEAITADLSRIAEAVHDRVESNFAIHAFVSSLERDGKAAGPRLRVPSSAAPAGKPTGRISKLLWLVRRGVGFLWQLDGIVFFGGYFYPERQSDGYFQRIQIIDRLFQDRWRIYVESEELTGRNIWFDRPEPNVLVLRVTGSKKLKMLVRMLAAAAVLRTRRIYFHSVLRMYDNRFGQFLHLPFVRKAVDIHGVVPEEFRMHDDFYSALIYDKQERLAVRKAGIVIVVTKAMENYLRQKFRGALKARSISFPMFPTFTPSTSARPLENGKPIVVYAGGLHRWQQVPKMIDAIAKTADHCQHRFYTPQPEAVKAMLSASLMNSVIVESKTHAELMEIYPNCHYGFILREDSIVNKVACPTKLVEYLAMGIVPIIDSENIGDFKSLGMQYITLPDFLASKLPDEETRVRMASENLAVYERLQDVREAGAEQIYQFFSSRHRPTIRSRIATRLRRVLPPETTSGRLARSLWRRMSPNIRGPIVEAAANIPLADLSTVPHECDVLVQVDNFEAGGLENVVLDLNDTLKKANYKIALLVLGNRGPAVDQARRRGQKVICQIYSPSAYERIIDHIKPKLVLAHYSTHGLRACNDRDIPFLQVIHNVYMWLNDRQRQEFSDNAKLTTKFIAVSDYVRDYSISRLGVPEEKCIVVPNGIDFAPFHDFAPREARESLREKYGITGDDFVFVDIGAINHQKNHLGTLKAFEIASRTCENAKLAILGPIYETALMDELNAYIATKGLEHKVIYCGAAPRSHEHFAMADAFVSGAFFEGGQLILLEAIRSNLPIVTSRVGFASSFEGRPGIEVVPPPQDIAQYKGEIWELKSTQPFESQMADAMIRTWKDPVRPNFSDEELSKLERSTSYEQYSVLVRAQLSRNEKHAAEVQTA
ncbi:glycosyltransferase [Rhizobium sp. P38BS-XIX]|uniref:glycosyltransferase n=1 Tax=Rhizobium sp. P38BS-XIX TaxID=2726740 RepID=UPI001456D788|nr:glycosyltransferase [Rhizobium sp. P38BS-XIX]NLR99423.1 glycosyltransferase [Rhizobium sp. P38BS-XIX]